MLSSIDCTLICTSSIKYTYKTNVNSNKVQTLLNNVILACSEHQSLWSPHQFNKELYGSIPVSIAIQRGNAMALTAGYCWNLTATNNMQRPQPANIHPERRAFFTGAA